MWDLGTVKPRLYSSQMERFFFLKFVSLFVFFSQDYLRHQPDNLRSYNLVSEVTQFVSVLYSNITGSTIGLLSLVFNALNELCQVS